MNYNIYQKAKVEINHPLNITIFEGLIRLNNHNPIPMDIDEANPYIRIYEIVEGDNSVHVKFYVKSTEISSIELLDKPITMSN